MPDREKRPPISVEELQKRTTSTREASVQGELTYLDQKRGKGSKIIWPGSEKTSEVPGRNGRGGKVGNKGSSMRLVLPVFVSVILAALMVFQFSPNKTEFGFLTADVEGLRSSVDTEGGKLNYEAGRIDNIVNSMGTYALKTELVEYAPGGELSSLRAQVESLQSYVDSLEARVVWLETSNMEE